MYLKYRKKNSRIQILNHTLVINIIKQLLDTFL